MKILIVDDSRVMRMLVLRTLRQAGFDAHDFLEAASGEEALAAMERGHPDLVLSDWNMPGISGLQLLDRLRELRFTGKFGFVTSEGTPEMRQLAADAGALFLIAKPFTPESFRLALQEHLR